MTVTLPTLSWGNPLATQHALMIHGLGSSAATCWQVMEALAEDGYHAVAVDLRGHGQAPRTSTYRIADFASDVALVAPEPARPWDAVIGHSIGAASAVVAASQHPDWARRLVLIDPALAIDDHTRSEVLKNQRLGHTLHGVEEIRELHPHWHSLDIQLKVHAHQQASLWALEAAVMDNSPWEKERGSMFYGQEAAAMIAAHTTWSYDLIPGAGHSVHRDKPEETMESLRRFLSRTEEPS